MSREEPGWWLCTERKGGTALNTDHLVSEVRDGLRTWEKLQLSKKAARTRLQTTIPYALIQFNITWQISESCYSRYPHRYKSLWKNNILSKTLPHSIWTTWAILNDAFTAWYKTSCSQWLRFRAIFMKRTVIDTVTPSVQKLLLQIIQVLWFPIPFC